MAAVPVLRPERLVKQSGCSRHWNIVCAPPPSSSLLPFILRCNSIPQALDWKRKKKEKGERVTSSSFLLLLTPSSYSSHRTAVMLGAAHDRGLFVLDTLPAVAPAELESPQ